MTSSNPSIILGIDLGDKKHSICVLDAAGTIIDERSITNHKESLRRLSMKYPSALIAIEVGTHSPWISRFLTGLGHRVLVANPRKLRAIYANPRIVDDALENGHDVSSQPSRSHRRLKSSPSETMKQFPRSGMTAVHRQQTMHHAALR